MDHNRRPDSIRPEKFVLVVGNSRSGTTMVGSILDSHPRMICANETTASANFWRGLDRSRIVDEIIANSFANYADGRHSESYSYTIETIEKNKSKISVVGDKVWNPALLLLAGHRNLLSHLQETMSCSVMLTHCVRNPFDVIATMYRRSGASLKDRLRWYTMHCEAIQILIERDDFPIFLIRHEDLTANPRTVSARLFDWLDHPTDGEHLTRIEAKVYKQPNKSRQTVEWSPDIVNAVFALTSRFDYLAGYSLES